MFTRQLQDQTRRQISPAPSESHLIEAQVVLDSGGDVKHQPVRGDHHHKAVQALQGAQTGFRRLNTTTALQQEQVGTCVNKDVVPGKRIADKTIQFHTKKVF